MKSLRKLDLSTTPITGAGMDFLLPMKLLESLDLGNTRIGNDAIGKIAEIASIRNLDLSGIPITDGALQPLVALQSLEALNLQNHETLSELTDESVLVLAQLPNLRELDLSGADISSDSMETLSQLNLKRLSLEKTNFSERDVEQLATLLPSTDIRFLPRTGISIPFDPDVNLGTLWIRELESMTSSNWIPFGNMQGLIQLPYETQVHLCPSLHPASFCPV